MPKSMWTTWRMNNADTASQQAIITRQLLQKSNITKNASF